MSHARSEYTDFQKLAPDAFEIVSSLGKVAARAGLDKQLLELIKLRASQINGCAFCVQYHILQAENLGVPRILLSAIVSLSRRSEPPSCDAFSRPRPPKSEFIKKRPA